MTMKIIEKKGRVICSWSRSKEPDLTWRKVREFCLNKIDEIKKSEEAKRIESYRVVITELQRQIDNFDKRLAKYSRMASSIKDTDKDIDTPFASTEEAT